MRLLQYKSKGYFQDIWFWGTAIHSTYVLHDYVLTHTQYLANTFYGGGAGAVSALYYFLPIQTFKPSAGTRLYRDVNSFLKLGGTVCWIEVKVVVLCAQHYMSWNIFLIKVLNNIWYFEHPILTMICLEAYLKNNWRNCLWKK